MAIATALVQAEVVAATPMSYSRTVAWRLARDPTTLVAGGVLALIVLSAVLAPWLAPYDPAAGSIRLRLAPVGSPESPGWAEGSLARRLYRGADG